MKNAYKKKAERRVNRPTQLLTMIIALCEAAFMCAFMIQMIITVLEFLALMIRRQPMAQALRTCVISFVETFPSMIAEATVITFVSFLIWSVI